MLSEEEVNTKGYTLHDSIYITFLKWQIGHDEEQISAWQELRTGAGGRDVGPIRERGGELVVMEMFCILTVSMSVSGL